MANREDIKSRIKLINPKALAVIEELDKQLLKTGSPGVSVTTTDDMSLEEKEMALFEGFLKEGYSKAEAAEKARQWLLLTEKL